MSKKGEMNLVKDLYKDFGEKLDRLLDRQKRVFTNFINERAKEFDYKIENLEDIKTGHALRFLLLTLCSKKSKKILKKITLKKGNNRIFLMDNIQQIFNFMKKTENIELTGIGANFIVDGDTKVCLALIWTIIAHYQLNLKTTKDGNLQDRGFLEMMNWINSKLPEKHRFEPVVESWKDGKPLYHLCQAFNKKFKTKTEKFKKYKNPAKLIKMCFKHADKQFDIRELLIPTDLTEDPDEKSLLTYLFLYRDAYRRLKKRRRKEKEEKKRKKEEERQRLLLEDDSDDDEWDELDSDTVKIKEDVKETKEEVIVEEEIKEEAFVPLEETKIEEDVIVEEISYESLQKKDQMRSEKLEESEFKINRQEREFEEVQEKERKKQLFGYRSENEELDFLFAKRLQEYEIKRIKRQKAERLRAEKLNQRYAKSVQAQEMRNRISNIAQDRAYANSLQSSDAMRRRRDQQNERDRALREKKAAAKRRFDALSDKQKKAYLEKRRKLKEKKEKERKKREKKEKKKKKKFGLF